MANKWYNERNDLVRCLNEGKITTDLMNKCDTFRSLNFTCDNLEVDLELSLQGVKNLATILKTNTSVRTLNLESNSIRNSGVFYIAEALKENTSISDLNLKWNGIGPSGALELSKVLKINTSLTTLKLWCNQIGDSGALELSKVLKINTSLTSLNLSYTGIGDTGVQYLLESLKSNSSLRYLNLHWNNLTSFSSVYWPALERPNFTFDFIDLNNWTNPPLDIVRKSVSDLKEYSVQLQKVENKVSYFSRKIIIVGENGVGKTTLRKRLMEVPTSQDESRTNGVDLQTWTFQKQNVQGCFYFWDFAGQVSYHSDHQFFLSQDALFLLVFDLSKDNSLNALNMWMKIIQDRVGSPNCQIVLIGTHCKQVKKPETVLKRVLHELQINHSAIKFTGSFVVDSLEGINTSKLQNFLQTENSISPIKEIPEKYLHLINLTNELVQKDCKFLTRDTLKSICIAPLPASLQTLESKETQSQNINNVELRLEEKKYKIFKYPGEELELAVKILHVWGFLMNFGELIVLDPSWLSKLISFFNRESSKPVTFNKSFLNSVNPNHPFFVEEDCHKIWGLHDEQFPPEHYNMFLEVLKTLQVIVPTELSGKKKYFVPAWIAGDDIPEKWNSEEEYHYFGKRFIFKEGYPVGLLHRLAAALVKEFYGNYSCKFWKHGIVLKAPINRKESPLSSFSVKLEQQDPASHRWIDIWLKFQSDKSQEARSFYLQILQIFETTCSSLYSGSTYISLNICNCFKCSRFTANQEPTLVSETSTAPEITYRGHVLISSNRCCPESDETWDFGCLNQDFSETPSATPSDPLPSIIDRRYHVLFSQLEAQKEDFVYELPRQVLLELKDSFKYPEICLSWEIVAESCGLLHKTVTANLPKGHTPADCTFKLFDFLAEGGVEVKTLKAALLRVVGK